MRPLTPDDLARIPLFHDLPPRELLTLARSATLEALPDGRVIARTGAVPDAVLVLVGGGARVCQTTREGKEATIALLSPGMHINVVALLTGTPRTTSVVTTARSELVRIPASCMTHDLFELPHLAHRLLVSLAHRLEQTSRHLAEMSLLDLPQRLLVRLRELAEPVELDGETQLLVRARPSHQALGNLLGVSREAVTRALKELQNEGVIQVRDDQVLIPTNAHATD